MAAIRIVRPSSSANTAAVVIKSDARPISLFTIARSSSPMVGFRTIFPKYGALPPSWICSAPRTDRLGLRRIGAFMFEPVALEDAPRVAAVKLQHARARDHARRSDARGNEVEQIIHFRAEPAEILISIVMVANHGIERVDRFIQEPPAARRQRAGKSWAPPRRRSHFRPMVSTVALMTPSSVSAPVSLPTYIETALRPSSSDFSKAART